jgi:hypothetical protein
VRRPGARRRGHAGQAGPEVASGEKVLAQADTAAGDVVAGTRQAIYLPGGGQAPHRLAWEEVESADWDADAGVLRVLGVGRFGEVRPSHEVALRQPERLLQLVRERVTASIVLQHRVAVSRGRGLRVVARRAPSGGRVDWFHEYDEGVDPDDPEVRRVAAEALAWAREQVGE